MSPRTSRVTAPGLNTPISRSPATATTDPLYCVAASTAERKTRWGAFGQPLPKASGQDGVVLRGSDQPRHVVGVSIGFFGRHEPGAHTDGRCAGGEQLAESLRHADPSGGDDRDIDACERLGENVERLYSAHVPAGLGALSHHVVA